jgi:hypothetical protein
MLQPYLVRLALCASMLFVGALPFHAGATELGEPLLRSYIGQPLVADIELTAFADPAPVQVRLAHQEVYNGAGIRMHPILANLTMSVMRRDGRQFLHITSIKPLDSEYVHLFLELADGARRDVRGVTLWLSADPHPAPPPLPVQAPAPVKPEPAAAATAPEPVLPRPSAPLAASPLRRAPAPRSAACVPQFSEEQIKTCAALDYKNGILTAQIVDLEEKVKLLQMAIEGKKPAAPPPLKLPAKAAAPASIAAKPKVEAKPSFPWLWVGIGVGALLLASGIGYWLWRRKKAAAVPAPMPGPSMMARVKARFGKQKEAAPEPRQEPAAE